RRAIALTPLEKDVINGSRVLQYFAITAAWAGEKELALQQLEAGLRAPFASEMLSYGALKLLPVWDPLRGDPRFEKIVASLAPKENRQGTRMNANRFKRRKSMQWTAAQSMSCTFEDMVCTTRFIRTALVASPRCKASNTVRQHVIGAG